MTETRPALMTDDQYEAFGRFIDTAAVTCT